MVHDQILDQLKKFVAGELDHQGLEEWVLSHLQQVLDSGEKRAIDLTNELDALFIEEGEELRAANEVHQEIFTLYNREVSTAWIEWGRMPSRASSEHTVHKSWGEPEVITGLNTHQMVA